MMDLEEFQINFICPNLDGEYTKGGFVSSKWENQFDTSNSRLVLYLSPDVKLHEPLSTL